MFLQYFDKFVIINDADTFPGTVAIFDASRGVEAQSRTVWRQADRHKVPRIVLINKMDKIGADYYKAIQSIKNEFNANCLPLHVCYHFN